MTLNNIKHTILIEFLDELMNDLSNAVTATTRAVDQPTVNSWNEIQDNR